MKWLRFNTPTRKAKKPPMRCGQCGSFKWQFDWATADRYQHELVASCKDCGKIIKRRIALV